MRIRFTRGALILRCVRARFGLMLNLATMRLLVGDTCAPQAIYMKICFGQKTEWQKFTERERERVG